MTTQPWDRWERALARFDWAVHEMKVEDAKPLRQRDSGIYRECYAVIETWALFFGVPEDDDDEERYFDTIRRAVLRERDGARRAVLQERAREEAE